MQSSLSNEEVGLRTAGAISQLLYWTRRDNDHVTMQSTLEINRGEGEGGEDFLKDWSSDLCR